MLCLLCLLLQLSELLIIHKLSFEKNILKEVIKLLTRKHNTNIIVTEN